MSERKFTIQEWGQRTRPDQPITESELKNRLAEIIARDEEGKGDIELDWAVELLLHGEGKEAVHDHIPLRGLSIEEIKRNYPEQYAQAITESEEFTDAQPDPWEAWVEGCPEFVSDNPNIVPAMFLIEWRRDLKHWIKKMPRGK